MSLFHSPQLATELVPVLSVVVPRGHGWQVEAPSAGTAPPSKKVPLGQGSGSALPRPSTPWLAMVSWLMLKPGRATARKQKTACIYTLRDVFDDARGVAAHGTAPHHFNATI